MYLNVVELAESFGVDESVVEGWVRHEGLPGVPDRGRLLFDRAQVVAWAASRGLAAKAGFLASNRPTAGSCPPLEPLLRIGGIWRDIPASDVLNVLERIVGDLPGATPAVRQFLLQRLRVSGGVTWAPVGGGLALPHLRAPVALGRNAGALALLLLREPLPVSEPVPDGQPVLRLLFFIAPSPRAHLELLGQLSAALRQGDFRRLVLEAASDDSIFAALGAAEITGGAAAAKGTKP
jgi:PTS system nitrogen regulatory IIA component